MMAPAFVIINLSQSRPNVAIRKGKIDRGSVVTVTGGFPVTISVVIPTKNERENVIELVPQILRLIPEGRVVFVDDESTDGTWEWLASTSMADDRVVAVKGDNRGFGAAIKKGMACALRLGAERIVTMDADLSHSTGAFPRLLKVESDLVLGSRYVPGAAIHGWSLRRRLISRFANRLATFSLAFSGRDVTTGFRVYSRELARVILEESKTNGFQFLIEAVRIARDHQMTISEVPITFWERNWGKSKLSTAHEARGFLSFILVRTRLKRFAVVVGSAILVNLVTFLALANFTSLSYMASALIAIEAAIIYSFVFHDRWTFSRSGQGRPLRRFVRYNTVAFAGLLINVGLLFFLTEVGNLFYLTSHFVGMSLALPWKEILPLQLTWGS